MSEPLKHLDYIAAELAQMAADGHFNEFEANKTEGAVRYELSVLREIFEELEKNAT